MDKHMNPLAIRGNSGGEVDGRAEPSRSGNPFSRSKHELNIFNLARDHAVESIATLAAIMQDPAVPASTRVSAAAVLLDRGYGRAPQSIDVRHRMTIEEQFESFVRELQFGGRGERVTINDE